MKDRGQKPRLLRARLTAEFIWGLSAADIGEK